MADIKISDLGAGTPLITDVYPAVDTTDPSQAPSGTTKKYSLLTLLQDATFKAACVTVTNLNATYNNLVGTLTNASTQAAFTADGVSPSQNKLVLVTGQTNQFQNGIYVLSTVGSASTNWVLTRVNTFSTPTSMAPGTIVAVYAGTTYGQTLWMMTSTITTVGTDNVVFEQVTVSSGGTVTSIAAGLGLTGGTITTSGTIALDTTFPSSVQLTPDNFNSGIAADATTFLRGDNSWAVPAGSGTGSVTSVSSGNLSPLFTSNVSNPTTTPAIAYTLANAGANTYLGNVTGGATTPSYTSAGVLTKVDDTNVTLTLGGNASTALLNAASISAGWTGTLSPARGGSGVNNGTSTLTLGGNTAFSGAFTFTGTVTGNTAVTFPTSGTLATTTQLATPAALTKSDDTNVTLTLGGTPTTALLQATSITAGWTGQLGVSRGGTGLATLTAHDLIIGNGTSAATLLAPSATSGVPLISQGASADPAYGTAVVAGGGSGRATSTAYAVICGGTTSTGAHQSIAALGSSGDVLTSNGAGALPTFQPASGGTGGTVVTDFTSSGTWTKNANAKWIRVYMWGGAGGGGSGRRGTADLSSAGAPGASGATVMFEGPTAVFPSSASLTVGAAGTGGSAQSSANSNGVSGGAGGASIFGSWTTGTVGGGDGGSTGTTTDIPQGKLWASSGVAVSLGNTATSQVGQAGTSGNNTGSAANWFLAPGAAGSGGCTSAVLGNTPGGNGSGLTNLAGTLIVSGAAGGVNGGTANGAVGQAASAIDSGGLFTGGLGGAGGCGEFGGNGIVGAGGAGGYPGAGGGGGGSSTSVASGAGGAGAAGRILVVEFTG